MNNTPVRLVTILGSTGSVGTQALEVVRRFPDRLKVHGLAAGANAPLLAAQARAFKPRRVAISDARLQAEVAARLEGTGIEVLAEEAGVCAIAAAPADVVVGAVSGIAGLGPVLAALDAGNTLALANKETLVAAGACALEYAKRSSATILPVDSEHSAIFQCLERGTAVESIVLTASGGPFLRRDAATFESITPADALQNPNWSMGPKVTIDSATLMNKGLEVIEARWLFDLRPEQIEVVIHPQSIVHSMVVFEDGVTKAQLSKPDMRLPIQYALCYPERRPSPHGRIDWKRPQNLTFEPPDLERFPCLSLAFEALRQGGTACAALNGANEEAVELFLQGHTSFTAIPRAIEYVLTRLDTCGATDLENVRAADAAARRLVRELPARSTG